MLITYRFLLARLNKYNPPPEFLSKYFSAFAIASQKKKEQRCLSP